MYSTQNPLIQERKIFNFLLISYQSALLTTLKIIYHFSIIFNVCADDIATIIGTTR